MEGGMGMVVGRLEVDGAHVVRLEVLPEALLVLSLAQPRVRRLGEQTIC